MNFNHDTGYNNNVKDHEAMKGSHICLAYVNGGRSVGARHQKHMMYAPTLFLYRVPSKRYGAGPVLMKYWWTLGNFPSGMEVPLRINEFKTEYVNAHVPADVEDWLSALNKGSNSKTVAEISAAATRFLRLLTLVPDPVRRGYKAAEPTSPQLCIELNKVLEPLLCQAPAAAVRSCASVPHLKRALFSSVAGLRHSIDVVASGRLKSISSSASGADAITTVESAPKPSDPTVQSRVVKTLTVLAQGCQLSKKHVDAAQLLQRAIDFCDDDRDRSETHASLAAALCGCGEFRAAVEHAQESVLLQRSPRGYATWAVATAYLDDVQGALEIVDDGLAEHGGDPKLTACREKLFQMSSGRASIRVSARGRRYHVPHQTAAGVLSKQGFMFDNPWDYTRFHNKLYAWRLDPTSASLGSDFRRVGNSAQFGHIASTQIDEPL
jgi:hypothetical protein